MSDSNPNPIFRRRWLAWRSDGPIMADLAETEPTKPSEPGFDGFDGSSSVLSTKIGAQPGQPNRRSTPVSSIQKSITLSVDLATASEQVMSWAEWKAGAINQLFLEQGTTGQPGRIAADTIRHGERRG